MYINSSGLYKGLIPPDVIQQLVARINTTGVHNKKTQ